MAFEQRFLNGFVVLTLFQLCSSSDTISPTRCITDGEILVSIRENFALGRAIQIIGLLEYGKTKFHNRRWFGSQTNVSIETNNSIAKLLDLGNLVLNNGPSNRVIWQSFDYPTDTWLPGMKLGINQKTGLNWTITSWKSSDNPARGDYSLGFDPRGSAQFFFYKGSAPYHRSGPWNGVNSATY